MKKKPDQKYQLFLFFILVFITLFAHHVRAAPDAPVLMNEGLASSKEEPAT
jgi:hypothetical protein